MSIERNERVGFAERVRLNQQAVRAALKPDYDSSFADRAPSGSVVARRFADNPEVDVLVLETGGPDDVQPVMEVIQWSS